MLGIPESRLKFIAMDKYESVKYQTNEDQKGEKNQYQYKSSK